MVDDPLYIGCTSDVYNYTQSLCAGHRECTIRVNDRHLEQTKPCYSELKSYLEVAYTCISGTCFNAMLLTPFYYTNLYTSEHYSEGYGFRTVNKNYLTVPKLLTVTVLLLLMLLL